MSLQEGLHRATGNVDQHLRPQAETQHRVACLQPRLDQRQLIAHPRAGGLIPITHAHRAAQHHQDLTGLSERRQRIPAVEAAERPAPTALSNQSGQGARPHQLLVLECHHLRRRAPVGAHHPCIPQSPRPGSSQSPLKT